MAKKLLVCTSPLADEVVRKCEDVLARRNFSLPHMRLDGFEMGMLLNEASGRPVSSDS